MGRTEELRKKLGITTRFYPDNQVTQLTKGQRDITSNEPHPKEPSTQESLLKNNLDNSIISFLLSFGLNHIEPLKFEEFTLDVFSQFGFTGKLTPVTGDDGIDIFLYDANNLKGVVQCKRYAENQNISVKEIREFLGSMIHVHAQFGYFITTTSFSEQAWQFSQGKEIYLIDREMLKQIVLHAIAIELGLYQKDEGANVLSDLLEAESSKLSNKNVLS